MNMTIREYSGWLALTIVCIFAAGCRAATPAAADGLLPFDARWHHSQYVGFRPGNGQISEVNPPRMSWPYLPGTVPTEAVPHTTFTLQFSKSGNFDKPDLEVRSTPYNFYNALPVFENTTWQWRVGYHIVGKTTWSDVRSFTFAPDAVKWDRTAILTAGEKMAAREHSLLKPAGLSWAEYSQKLKANTRTAKWLEVLERRAGEHLQKSWWKEFPATDVAPERSEIRPLSNSFARISNDLAEVALAHRLTGDARFDGVRERALKLAAFPRGGVTSPEGRGGGTKMVTQIPEHLAVIYDLQYDLLSPAEREALQQGILWRVQVSFDEYFLWRNDKETYFQGLGVFGSSHAFQNAMWLLPATLLMSRDVPQMRPYSELLLHYLTGVTSPHGPEEGWNEGLGYGAEKADTMLKATLYAQLLLPELELGKNPVLPRLSRWFNHVAPQGAARVSFGDAWVAPLNMRTGMLRQHRNIALLTKDAQARATWMALAADGGEPYEPGLYGRPWLELLANIQLDSTDWNEAPPARTQLFAESGWVMASSRPLQTRKDFDEAVGMILMSRPRGSYSHSNPAENSFVWHAYGQTLAAGGGSQRYNDPYPRQTWSHNTVVVNGIGQSRVTSDYRQLKQGESQPFIGRILAYREAPGYVYWAAEATRAYPSTLGLQRFIRHVVFVDGKWFAIYDDLAMKPEAEPARFSWLLHVEPKVPIQIENGEMTTLRYQVKDVHAQVMLLRPQSTLEVENLRGADGLKNLITGQNLTDASAPWAKDAAMGSVENHIWATNRQPAREWDLLSVLLAWREGDEAPQATSPGRNAVRVRTGNGPAHTVSFNPAIQADIMIDVEAVRRHARESDPYAAK